MGCTASRSLVVQGGREKFGSSRRRLGKSVSLSPLPTQKEENLSYNYHVVALTSSTYGIMKLVESENVDENLVSAIGGVHLKLQKSDSFSGREKSPKTWTDMAMAGYPRFKIDEELENEKKPLQDSVVTASAETINTWELMEGLDDGTPRASPLVKTIPTKEAVVEIPENVSASASVKALPRSRSLSSIEGMKALNKMLIAPELLDRDVSSQRSTNKSFDLSHSNRWSERKGSIHGQVMGYPVAESREHSYSQTTISAVSSDSSLEEATDSNLFDPAILASFAEVTDEKTSLDDDWCHIRSSDGESSTSASMAEDDSPMQWDWTSGFGKQSSKGVTVSKSGTYGSRKISFAKIAPVGVEDLSSGEADLLSKFEKKCPPGGENRVVLYLTSLRGIVKTFEDCHSLKMILQSFSVWVDERDVSMHAEFRQELKSLTGGPIPVPRVFIKGHYIGGFDEIHRLHEDGKLGELLRDLPTHSLKKSCEGCGGVRFVPCFECSGSCKVVTEFNEVTRCLTCNENGLARCPICK